MPWLLVIVGALFEIAWALLLPTTRTFTKLLPSIAVVVCVVASLLALTVGARSLPIGTAYAVWVGIGATGTAVLGMVVHHDPVTTSRLVFLGLLIVSILGLKATGGA